jgi:hypothetical protein
MDAYEADAGRVMSPEEDVVVIESNDPADDQDPVVEQGQVAGTLTGDAERWSEIKAMFVDDPGESVKLASGLVDRAIQNLMASLRQRQESLATWEADDSAGTEELRNALRGYRSLFEELDGMTGQLRSGPGESERRFLTPSHE